jgi:TRAP-type transport system periplasmic protein
MYLYILKEEVMKKILAVLMVSLVMVTIAGAGGQGERAPGGVVTIKLAHDNPVATHMHKGFEEFKRLVESESEGQIMVTIYPGGQMGSVQDTFEQARRGDLEMSVGATTLLTQTIPEFYIWDLFSLFESSEHAHAVLDGPAGWNLLEPLDRFGLTGLGYMEVGFRNFSNSRRQIEKIEDFQGLKIRGYSPTQIAAWEAVGCNLTTLSWTEVFTSLQQNLIDGQESATTSFYDARFYEAQKYWTLTNHVYTNYMWYANSKFMESLTEAQQQIVMDAAKQAIVYQRRLSAEQEGEAIAKIKEAGILVNDLPSSTKVALGERLNSVVKDEIIQKAGKEIYDMVMAEVEAARSR